MTDSHAGSSEKSSNHFVIVALVGVLALYGLAAAKGWPQEGTLRSVPEAAAAARGEDPTHAKPEDHADEKPHADDAGHAGPKHHPHFFMVVPFCLLLGAIAVLPLMHRTEHFWESNRNKFLVAGGLALVTLAYYAFAYHHPVARHFLGHAELDGTWQRPWVIFQNSILKEFIPFIVLLFSLYTISGGIRISGDLPAHPKTNTAFLAVGGLLASFIGTTGAAMLLIRPVLETNSERKHVAHTVVFFIFIVCNCGGCLLPIGDPPLFLGYLQGVDFLWTLKLWKQWLLINGALLAIYFLWDSLLAYPREEKRDLQRDESQVRSLKLEGLMPNALLLVGVVLAAALLDPSKPFPGTRWWYPWLYFREAVQLGLVLISLMLGSKRVREANSFNYGAIVEVAALFIGIFICMQPALQILGVRGGELGVTSTTQYFWATGTLSSVLDNAPTYLVFYELAHIDPKHLTGASEGLLAAISLGAVFMGANTYIGNGPNFMVKTVAEKSGIKMPSFFGYMLYSMGILIPLFVAVTFLFFR